MQDRAVPDGVPDVLRVMWSDSEALEAFVACRAPTAACAVMDGLLGVLLVHVTPRVPALTRLECLL